MGLYEDMPGSGKAKGGSDAAAVERRFERVLDHLHAVLLEFDGEGRITYVSPTVTAILGYLPEEIRELRRFEWIHAEDVAQILELSRKLASTGESAEAVYRARHKQGRWLWLEMSASSYPSPGGGIRTLAFVHDVTEARQAGRALRITEDRFRAMAENAADLISEIDGDGRFVYVSPNCESLLGTPADAYARRQDHRRDHPGAPAPRRPCGRQRRVHPARHERRRGPGRVPLPPRGRKLALARGARARLPHPGRRAARADHLARRDRTGSDPPRAARERRALPRARRDDARSRDRARRRREDRLREPEQPHDAGLRARGDGGDPPLHAAPPRRRRAARGFVPEPRRLDRAAPLGHPAARPTPRRFMAVARGGWRQLPHRSRRDARRRRGARRDGTAARRGRAAQAGGMDPAGPEAREPGRHGRRHRARLQQPADADPGRREPRAAGPAAGLARPHAAREDPEDGAARGRAHEPDARLRRPRLARRPSRSTSRSVVAESWRSCSRARSRAQTRRSSSLGCRRICRRSRPTTPRSRRS